MKPAVKQNISALFLICILGVTWSCTSNHAVNLNGPESARSVTGIEQAMPYLLSDISENDFETTLSKVQAAIENRAFKIFAVIDHAAGAASIGQELRPTSLIIFGNPKGGTPLMLSAQTMGIELPLKMLVHENEAGDVIISWSDMEHVFSKHGVIDRGELLQKIMTGLASIAAEASSSVT